MTVRTRIAPSPTGFLHLGTARTALYSWAYARHHGGQFVLRIEDTDVARSSDESVQQILDSMQWLGLDYDEGPHYQMRRLDRYHAVVEQMIAAGTAYRCYSTPEELAGVPAHMRQTRVCVGGPATYRLQVQLDEHVIADEIVHGGGLRGDRPIYVFRETLVTPGERVITVRFTRQEAGPPAPASAVPDSLVLERRVRLVPRGVALVTYDEEARTMAVR